MYTPKNLHAQTCALATSEMKVKSATMRSTVTPLKHTETPSWGKQDEYGKEAHRDLVLEEWQALDLEQC